MENLIALIGVIIVGLAVAGVPDEAGIALIVGGALALGPAIAALAGSRQSRSAGKA